jgi:hypothetical protein
LYGFRSHSSKTSNQEREVWSGDKNRAVNYNLGNNATVTIDMGGEGETNKQEAVKKVPVWMSQSTVEGAQEDGRVSVWQTIITEGGRVSVWQTTIMLHHYACFI